MKNKNNNTFKTVPKSKRKVVDRDKGNNKITEYRAIFQKGKAKLINQHPVKISQQPENWENRNGP